MKIRFNDSETVYDVTAVRMHGNIVILKGTGLPNNTSGFKLFGSREEKDYSEYRYIFNVITKFENVVMLSNDEGFIETEDNPAGRYYHEPDPDAEQETIEDPLTNEELTEAVANLMYETSMMQLGMEV